MGMDISSNTAQQTIRVGGEVVKQFNALIQAILKYIYNEDRFKAKIKEAQYERDAQGQISLSTALFAHRIEAKKDSVQIVKMPDDYTKQDIKAVERFIKKSKIPAPDFAGRAADDGKRFVMVAGKTNKTKILNFMKQIEKKKEKERSLEARNIANTKERTSITR